MSEDALNNGSGTAVEQPGGSKVAEPQLGGLGNVMPGGNMGSTEGPGAIVQQKAGEVAAAQANAGGKKGGPLGFLGKLNPFQVKYEDPNANSAGKMPEVKAPASNGIGLAPQPPGAAPLETRPDGTVATPQMANVTPEAQAVADAPPEVAPQPDGTPVETPQESPLAGGSVEGTVEDAALATGLPVSGTNTEGVQAPTSSPTPLPVETMPPTNPGGTDGEIPSATDAIEPERPAVAAEVEAPAADAPASPGLEATTPVPSPDLTANGQAHQEIHETDLAKAATATEADEEAQTHAEQTNTVENRPPDPLAVPEFHPTDETAPAQDSPNPDAVASGGDLSVTAEEPDKKPEDQQWHVEPPAQHADPLAVTAPAGIGSTEQPPAFSNDALSPAGDPAAKDQDPTHEETMPGAPLPIPGTSTPENNDDSSKWQVQAGTPAPAGEVSDDTQAFIPPAAETVDSASAGGTTPGEALTSPAVSESNGSTSLGADSAAVETPVEAPPATAPATEPSSSEMSQQHEAVDAGQTPSAEVTPTPITPGVNFEPNGPGQQTEEQPVLSTVGAQENGQENSDNNSGAGTPPAPPIAA